MSTRRSSAVRDKLTEQQRRARELGEHPSHSVSWGLQVAAAWSVRLLLVAAAVFVILRLLNAVSLVTITVVIAVMVSALFQPPVGWLRRKGLPRPVAALLVFVLGMTALLAAIWFVVSQVSANSSALGGQLHVAGDTIRGWLVNGPGHLSQSQVDELSKDVTQAISGNRRNLVAGLFATANSALGILAGLVFCLFAILFMLFDDGSIWRWLVGLFPGEAQPKVAESGRVAWRTLIAYMRSTVLLALINALTMVGIMMAAGLPLVVPLGVLLFLGSMIPLVGMLVAGVVVVLVALVTKSMAVAIVMAVALFLTIQLEGNLLNPWILGKAVRVHPLGILVTVTAGTLLGGIFGAFIAVPLVAIINNVVGEVHRGPPEPLPEIPDAGT